MIRMYTIIILPFVLYGCENGFVTLREEHRLGVYEIGVVRENICGPKREDVRGGWRKLRDEELRDLCSFQQVSLG
jgi:hypothetical protein